MIFPLSWVALAQGPQGGRPLRDLLIDAAGLSVDAILEADLLPGEPRMEPEAAKARTAARKAASEAGGRLAEATAAAAEAEAMAGNADAPTSEDLDAHRATMASADRWATYRAAYERHVASVEAAARAEESLIGWRKEREALGERPTATKKQATAGAVLAKARAAREEAETAVAVAVEASRTAQHAATNLARPQRTAPTAEKAALDQALKAHGAAASALKAQPAGKTCPTCHRDGWGGAEEARAALIAEVAARLAEGKEARVALNQAEAAHAAAYAEAEKAHREQSTALINAAKEASARLEGAREALANANAAADAAADLAADPGIAWDARSRALGAEPQVPAVLAEPENPGEDVGDEPTPEATTAARHALHAAEIRAAAGKMAGASLEAVRARLTAAAEACAEAANRRDRADAVVEIVRQAPSRLEAAVMDALAGGGGDDEEGGGGPDGVGLGPVGITFTEAGGVDVTVSGLPWWCASRGELAVADLRLRAAIRQACGLGWLPIVVDNAQDWSGDWPDVPGPVWMMLTEAGGELTVEEA